MNDIRCPECNGREYQIDWTEGSIAEGWFVENVECINCQTTFVVKASFIDIEIEGGY